jgi:hypothetical protein
MNLRELLDEARRNVLRDISTAVTRQNDDELWSDDALVMYIRDAEEKFAAGTLCLRDSKTAATCTITLADGVSEYLMDRRVIACYAATYNGNIALGRTSHATRFGARGDITPKTATREPMATGEPRLFYTDRDTGYIGFYPTPGAEQVGDTVRIQVARRPLVPLSTADMTAEPEIPDEFHLDLLEWAVWRALRNHDADIDGDPNNISIVMARASMHKKRFEGAMTECKRKMKYLNTQHVDFGVNANWS